jgi:hypothetical protein
VSIREDVNSSQSSIVNPNWEIKSGRSARVRTRGSSENKRARTGFLHSNKLTARTMDGPRCGADGKFAPPSALQRGPLYGELFPLQEQTPRLQGGDPRSRRRYAEPLRPLGSTPERNNIAIRELLAVLIYMASGPVASLAGVAFPSPESLFASVCSKQAACQVSIIC